MKPFQRFLLLLAAIVQSSGSQAQVINHLLFTIYYILHSSFFILHSLFFILHSSFFI